VARPELWICRHGETDWSRDGRHTSHTDLLLTPAGVDESRRLIAALADLSFDLVLTSPLRRASDTADLLGYADARREPALAEWHYGDYEGMTTPEIREQVPDWTVWTHPCPGGETAGQVAARADRVIDRVLSEATERALVFSHGHLLRALAARWIGEEVAFGRRLVLATGTLSVLGWERDIRAVARWNAPPSAAPAATSAGRPAGASAGASTGTFTGGAETPESSSGVEPPRP
jgi:probable phosphoglycerate mutase